MAIPANILQTVQTYQKSGLAYLQNLYCFVNKANTKFKNFQDMTANLGDTVGFDLPPRMTVTNSLVASFQSANQRVHTLTVDQQGSVAYAFTAQQFIFNVKDYMERFGKAAIAELGAEVESSVARNCVTAPFRFFGDGRNQISSYTQLATMLASYRNFGAPLDSTEVVIPDMAVPQIIGSGLNQFAQNRNNEIANSWELGSFSRAEFYQSNLLPTHIAGTAGQTNAILTVTAVTTNASGAVTAITATVGGAPGADPDMIKQHDKMQFRDGVAGQQNVRFRTFIGHKPSQSPVQMRATADAESNGASSVTITIDPPLQAAATSDQNITTPIVAGMQIEVANSHRAGVVMAGKPLFLGMPRLPDQRPFDTANEYDSETGVSIRQTYGSRLGENTMGMIHDCIWGSTLVPEYSMSILFPLTN